MEGAVAGARDKRKSLKLTLSSERASGVTINKHNRTDRIAFIMEVYIHNDEPLPKHHLNYPMPL
ncbi:MAG: hypothetical protein ACPIG6_02870 [Akkermansiaceae bacterium]